MESFWMHICFAVMNILTTDAKCVEKTAQKTTLLTTTTIRDYLLPTKHNEIITTHFICPECSMAVTGGIFPGFSPFPIQKCPRCWCQNSMNFYSFKYCYCNCLFTFSNTPNIILTWNETNTDLDLHVIDPSGEEISWTHLSSKSGGRLLRDMQRGPNAVELISWGINNDRKGPNGSYKVYVVAYSLLRVSISFSVAILESVDQPWWYFNGTLNGYQKQLVREFTINSNSSMSSTFPFNSTVAYYQPSIIGVCAMIYGPCDCGYDENCICSCVAMTTTSFYPM